MAGAFGFWLLIQLADAARRRLGEGLFGSEQERALSAVGAAAIARTARELRPDGFDEDVEHLAAVVDQVFQAHTPAVSLGHHPTLLQALQTGVTGRLAVLGDGSVTGTGQSSAQALGLPVQQVTETLVRNVVQEILARGAGGGPLASLADQLNHDLTHVQGERTAGMLTRIVDQLAPLSRSRVLDGQPVPRELPRPAADFTGRRDELARLRDLLSVGAGGSAVVITAIDGMGGIGKSALALQVAHELLDAGAFPDGQLYVNLQGSTPGLAPLEPLDALGRMLRALGLEPAQIPTDIEEAAARFRSLAAQRQLLVLLDNAASAEQVRPLLPASRTCGVLITSRQVLASLEGTRSLHLDVLPPDQALKLLGRIAGEDRIAADPLAAAEVLQRCGYLPLAIRIAGARLSARPAWQVRVLATRLADATHRLEELQVGELAVRASFDVSLQALQDSPDPLDQAAAGSFGLLSLPDGPDLALVSAARLLDQPEPTTHKVLERLVDTQLLESPRPDRYQFHDLVRLYARQHAESRHPEPERLAALTRLLAFYTATAWHTLAWLHPADRRIAAADQRWTSGGLQFVGVSAALNWLEEERADLLAAIPQAAAAAVAIPAELPCQLTQALSRFLAMRGYWQDGVQINQIVFDLARSIQDPAVYAHALSDLGSFYRWQGRYEEAIACQQESLAIRRELDDHHGEAYSLSKLGVLYRWVGRYEEAIACQQDSLTIFRELDDHQGEAYSLNDLGAVYRLLGRYAEAIACQQDSLAIFRELGDRPGEAHSLNDLGRIYGRLRRYEEAIPCHQDSLAIFRELGDRPGEAHSLNDLGRIYGRLRRYEEAIYYQEDSLTILRQLGDHRGESYSLKDLGVIYQRVGRYGESIACHQDSLAIFRQLGDRHGEAHSLNSLGVVYFQQGRHDGAIACQQDSLSIHQELCDFYGQADTLRDLGDVLRAAGRSSQAGAAWREALAIYEELGISEADTIRERLATLPSEVVTPPRAELSP